jgi:outer membrane protein assembly factor BamB
MNRRVRRACALALVLLLGTTQALLAQSSRNRREDRLGRNTLSRKTAGGGDFPTWEREVESDERSPLPEGRPGRYVPAWAAELGSVAAGVTVAGGSTFVVPLTSGSIRLVGLDGAEIAAVEGGGRVTQPPIAAGTLALVAAGERIVAVSATGLAWRSDAAARIVQPPAWAGSGVYVAREGGTLERISHAGGRREWSVALGGEAGAAPSANAAIVVTGVGGDVVGLDADDGAELFRLPLGDRVDSVLVTESMLYAAGIGPSGRSAGGTPVVAGWKLGREARPSGRPWRLRVGGTCPVTPSALDEHVTFACSDGYVRAIDRRKGVGGWKTDLPAWSTSPPVVSGLRLDFVIPQSRHAVALSADNGAVMGWVTLPDEDETFVGSSAGAGGITASATSFARLVGWRWEWDPEAETDDEDEPLRPGEDREDAQRRGISVPISR